MPAPPSNELPPIERLCALMAILRSPQGCPWDQEQTLDSLKRFLVEEAYEVLDAIEDQDRDRLREELGDLLLQIVFQAQLCEEEGAFTLDDVASCIVEKLIRRHPHVFGEVKVDGADEVLRNWDRIKREERQDEETRSVLDGVPRHMPSLQRAFELQKRAARQGFDWKSADGVLEKIGEEVAELNQAIHERHADAIREELGDLLFSIVNLARFLDVEPEEALRQTSDKFTRRFQAIEAEVHDSGKPMSEWTLAELDAAWDRAKTGETDLAHGDNPPGGD